jgi:hypothetical protein
VHTIPLVVNTRHDVLKDSDLSLIEGGWSGREVEDRRRRLEERMRRVGATERSGDGCGQVELEGGCGSDDVSGGRGRNGQRRVRRRSRGRRSRRGRRVDC